jgi:hypothetical protein
MSAAHYPEFECCRVASAVDDTIIRCPGWQNVLGTWRNLLSRYAADKDHDGVLRLAKAHQHETVLLATEMD